MKLTINKLVLVAVKLILLWHDVISQEFQGVCGGTQTGRRGTFTSPGYPAHYPVNQLCVWVLTTSAFNGKVRLIFDYFQLEPDSSCRYDYVLVRDGSSPTNHMIGKFCGSSKPATITSSGRALWIEFRSDSSDTRPGFLARWETEYAFPHTESSRTPTPTKAPQVPLSCGGTIHGTRGIITSPHFPDKYPNNKKCKWAIISPSGTKVLLQFNTLNIENGRSCRYDYLEIRDGGDSSGTFLFKLCGRTYPSAVRATGNMLYLEFNSDSSETASGFRLEWYAEGRTTPLPSPTTPYVPTTEEPTPAPGGCDLTLRGSGGTIRSPSYPNNYPINKKCGWTIKVESGEHVELEFRRVDLERDSTCRYDYIEVRDGSNEDAALKERFCGNTVPQAFASSGDALHVAFFSDASETRSGFHAIWKAVDGTGKTATNAPPHVTTKPPAPEARGCGGSLTALNGVIQSPQYPRNYPTNTMCHWRIHVPQGYRIRLEFSNFNLEADSTCRFDYLLVYDGPSVTSAELGRLCGDDRSSRITSMDTSTNEITVVFNSDSSVTAPGFQAYWNAHRGSAPEPTSPFRLITSLPTPPTGRCGGNFIKPSGDIISPGYPYYYGNNVDCVWVVGVPDSKLIALGFNEFELEGGDDCRYDYVEVRDGESSNSPLIGKYCGSTAPLMLRGSSDKLWVKFHTNGFVSSKGFEATWTTEAQIIKPFGGLNSLQGESRQPSPAKKCGHPLGLESKKISDSQLSASSSWMSSHKYGAQQARLNNRKWPQGWVADSRDENPWLKIKLNGRHIITGIATQGYGNQIFNEWVKSYQVSWYADSKHGYVNYQEQGIEKLYDGNTDSDSVVRHRFKVPINAEEIIIRPKTWHGNVGLRVELYGCPLVDCMEPLGLANGAIKDDQLKASSAWNHDHSKYGASRARLNITSWPQGWTASEEDRFPWLQINLQDDYVVTHVATQGFGGALNQWVKSYKLTWMDGNRNWQDYYVPRAVGVSEWRIKRFHANSDRNAIVRHVLKIPFRSKVIRIWPQERHNFVSMRTELYGCPIEIRGGETRCARRGNRLIGESRLTSVKQCVWPLSTESTQGKYILKFDEFSFENSDPSCTKDYVEVRNGFTQYAPLIGKYCGSNKPQAIRSSNGALWVRFVVSGEKRTKVAMNYEFLPQGHANRNEGTCGVRPLARSHSSQRHWPGQWPWQVALSLMGQSNQQCGGALIGSRWVLTAAHCFNRFQLFSYWIVQAGVWDLRHKDANQQELSVKAIYVHPQYDRPSHRNDIALLYLEKEVTSGDRVRSICLGKHEDLKPGNMCSVAGWGSSTAPQGTSVTLLHKDLPLVSNQQCNHESKYGGRVDANMVCAGYTHGGGDSCYGDGGSPLMCQDASNKWVVSGISSWGEGCGMPGKYGVYTNVASYKRWIDKVMSSH